MEYANECVNKWNQVLAEIRALSENFANPRYMELLLPNFYKSTYAD
jgi:hypothetical protein